MELSQLEILKTIVEEKTMTAAAGKLHMTQPALSASIRKLEAELGVKLFSRSNNRITLNEAGMLVYRDAETVLKAVQDLQEHVQQYRNDHDTVHLLFDDPGPMWYLIPNLQMAYGTQKISGTLTKTSVLQDELLNHQAQFIISSEPLKDPAVHCEELIEEYVLLSVPEDSSFASYREIDLLQEHPDHMIRYRVNGSLEQHKQDFWHELEQKCRITVYTDYFMFSQVLQNENAVTVTTRIVQHYRSDGDNRILIPVTSEGTRSKYYLSWLEERTPQLSAYIQSIHFLISKI